MEERGDAEREQMRELIHLITGTSKKIMRIHLKTEIPSQMQFGWKTETAKIKLCAAMCFPLFVSHLVSPFRHLLFTSVLFSSLLFAWPHRAGCYYRKNAITLCV